MRELRLPAAVVRHRLIDATVGLVAEGGSRAVTASTVARRAGVGQSAVIRSFGGRDQLLKSAAASLARVPVLPAPDPRDASDSIEATLQRLVRAHRAFAARSPERFAALLQFSSAALWDAPSLGPILASRNASIRATARAHLVQLQASGEAASTADVTILAAGFVDAMTGIEICHLVDDDPVARDAAYRELCAALLLELGRRARRV